jgi:hypothetical protein
VVNLDYFNSRNARVPFLCYYVIEFLLAKNHDYSLAVTFANVVADNVTRLSK